MDSLRRLLGRIAASDRRALLRLATLTGLFFLIICAIGILRPIKNALALEGLAEGDFYKVYLVSAGVVAFVPLFNRLADRIPWRRLLSLSAFFFAALLLGLRLWYGQGSALFGLLFYGWYDLIAAVLVTHYFMATQLIFDAREAKKFYPVVIGGGSVGATLGGAVTGLTAETVGLPNLMLVAAGLIAGFGIALPLLWREEPRAATGEITVIGSDEADEDGLISELGEVFGTREVLLITGAVLLTVLIKQIVDYQFNTISKQVYADPAAISEFQGWFNAATQWLPLVVLATLGPVLRRWGVGIVLFMFPVFMVAANVGLAATWSLAAAVIAKGGDTGIRYAAERTSREILYVPIHEDLKLRAKGWIDVAVEKGLGKALSAFAIFGLLQVMDFEHVGWIAAGLAAVAVVVARHLHGEYVTSLSRSLERRIASVRGVFASLTDATTLPAVRRTLHVGDPPQIAFLLDLLDGASAADREALADDVAGLLSHGDARIRRKALDVLPASPEHLDREDVRPLLADDDPGVRERAVRALAALRGEGGRQELLREILGTAGDGDARRAALACLARGEIPLSDDALLRNEFLPRRWARARAGDRGARLEVALACGAVDADDEDEGVHGYLAELVEDADDEDEGVHGYLAELVEDADVRVASAALRSAGRLRDARFDERLVHALGDPGTRVAAADGLVARGQAVVGLLVERLGDEGESPRVRRHVPRVLARIPSQETVDALLASYAAPETDQLLDFRTLKALNKLRAREAGFAFERGAVVEVLEREVSAATRYAGAADTLDALEAPGALVTLLTRTVREAMDRRREAAFRCLGLLLPPEEVYRSYLAVTRGDRRSRANAVEWLDNTADRELFARVERLLEAGGEPGRGPSASVLAALRGRAGAGTEADDGPDATIRRLASDKDRWVARVALWSLTRRHPEGTAAFLDRYESPDPGLRRVARWLAARASAEAEVDPFDRREPMDPVAKVLLLQNVDLLEDARSDHLALVASVAEEVKAKEGAVLLRPGEPTDAMYVVMDGRVEIRSRNERLLEATAGMGFGTWALIDAEPSLAEARAVESTRLLRIRRTEFDNLLADNPELARELLQGLARRLRGLVKA